MFARSTGPTIIKLLGAYATERTKSRPAQAIARRAAPGVAMGRPTSVTGAH